LCNQGEPAPKKFPLAQWLANPRHLAGFCWYERLDHGQSVGPFVARNIAALQEVDGRIFRSPRYFLSFSKPGGLKWRKLFNSFSHYAFLKSQFVPRVSAANSPNRRKAVIAMSQRGGPHIPHEGDQ
jgi:hypothetical protein